MRIGFDIGGTKIETRVLDLNGEEVFRNRVATPKSYEPFVEAILESVQAAEQAVGTRCSVGIGLPGAVCPHTGRMKMPIVPFSMVTI